MKLINVREGGYKMSRILILAPNPPWYLGGIEKVVKETAIRLAQNSRVNIEIWCKDSENKTTLWNGIKVRTFKKTLPFGLSLDMMKELKRLQKQFDIIHIHGTSNLYPLEVLLVIDNWKNIVVSSHYHSKGSNVLFRLTKPLYDKIFVSKYLRKASSVICVSKTEKEILLAKFKLPLNKIRVIHNGVPVDKIKAFKPKKVSKQEKVSILYFGRLERYKNIHVLIESLRYLPNTFVLYIVGKGSYERELHKLTEDLNLQERVKFLGFLPEENLYSLLHSVDLVVNLSEIEAFGIMAVESICTNRPVLVNPKGGLKEIAEYFPGIVFPVNPNPKEVASKIEALSLNRKYKVGRKIYLFDWSVIISQFVELYKFQRDI